MVDCLIKLLLVARSKLKSRARLEAENIVLCHQRLIVLNRKEVSRLRFRNIGRLILVWLYRSFPSISSVLAPAPEFTDQPAAYFPRRSTASRNGALEI